MAVGDLVQWVLGGTPTTTLGAVPTPGNTLIWVRETRNAGGGSAPTTGVWTLVDSRACNQNVATDYQASVWYRPVVPGDTAAFATNVFGGTGGMGQLIEVEGLVTPTASGGIATIVNAFLTVTLNPAAGLPAFLLSIAVQASDGAGDPFTTAAGMTNLYTNAGAGPKTKVDYKVVNPTSGSYLVTPTYPAQPFANSAIIGVAFTGVPPPPDPGIVLDVYDQGDVLVGTLTDAFDVQVRAVLNSTGEGKFSIRRDSPDATAELLQPGNYVRVTIPQIDLRPIMGFFLDKGDFALISTKERGGEIIKFGGKGPLSYWARAIWLSESFLVEWWPSWLPDPDPADKGAISFASGSYYRLFLSGTTSAKAGTTAGTRVTSKTKFHTGGFTAYYDKQINVHPSVGSTTLVTVVRLSSGSRAGFWVNKFGPGRTRYTKKATYVFGNSVLMESIDDGDKPGQVIKAMYDEAFASTRPIHPIPLMSIDFDATNDSDGDPWTVSDALKAVSAKLHDDYSSTITKLVDTGAIDVDMGPNFDMHAYNFFGRDLHGTSFGPGVVRFAKGVNIADELIRQFTDPPVGTFAEVAGNAESAIARVALPGAGTRPPREIGVKGDTDDTDALEALGISELEARLLHSDAVGFAVDTPTIGNEDPDNGEYLPGPRWTTRGNYWVGDLATVHTGTAENDFNQETLRIAAITLRGTAGGLRVIVEVGSSIGGRQGMGNSDSSSGPTSSGGSGGSGGSGSIDLTVLADYQLLVEKDLPSGYAGLDDNGLVPFEELPTKWKQPVDFATTGPLSLTTGFEVGDVVDGVTLVVGMSFLNKDASAASEARIYVVNDEGDPYPRADFDADVDTLGAIVPVRLGDVNARSVWILTNETEPVLGTDDLFWETIISGPATASPGGMVPYLIASGDTFVVLEPYQALYAEMIDVEGTLDVEGLLIEVD